MQEATRAGLRSGGQGDSVSDVTRLQITNVHARRQLP